MWSISWISPGGKAIFRSYIETEDAISAQKLIVDLKADRAKFTSQTSFHLEQHGVKLIIHRSPGNSVMNDVQDYFDRAIQATPPGDEDAKYWIYHNWCVAGWFDGDAKAAADDIDRLTQMSESRTAPPWNEFAQWGTASQSQENNPQMMSTAAQQWDNLNKRYRSGS